MTDTEKAAALLPDNVPMGVLRELREILASEINSRACIDRLEAAGLYCREDFRDGHTMHTALTWGRNGGEPSAVVVTWEHAG